MFDVLRDFALPLLSAAFAVVSSCYSLRRTPLASVDYETGPSIGDAPELHILTNRVAIYQLGEPNKIAGYCSIIAAAVASGVPILVLAHWLN
ncbi:MAG: hypothetical protein WBF58_15065 [Xanthobacteraceae bacterium]